MIIDCISDLHGHYPNLDGGDLLIIAGDLTASDQHHQYVQFIVWLEKQEYKKKIVVAGNHDNILQKMNPLSDFIYCADYLCDSATEFEELKIWGSPWTKTFPHINPRCKAFTCGAEEELAEKWKLIPKNIDILITHGPSQGVLDEVKDRSCGSSSLIKPMIQSGCVLHIFGHIHESYGKFHNPILGITYINCSHVNENYEPVNKPIRIIYEDNR